MSQSCVIRRFTDFEWLHTMLTADLPGQLLPALPDKALMGRFSPEFVEERRRALQLFLQRCMDHAVIKRHETLRLFLNGTDVALGAAKQLQAAQTKPLQSAGKSFLSFWNTTISAVSSSLGTAKDHPKTDDDVAAGRMIEYTLSLQAELHALELQVSAWLGTEKALGKAWYDVGMSASMLSQAEGAARSAGSAAAASDSSSVDYSPPESSASSSSSSSASASSVGDLGLGGDAALSRALAALGASSDALSNLLAKKEADESVEFKEPLRDAYRTAQAVEAMLRRRQECLAEYHSCCDAVDAARRKLESAQSTPGKEGKIPAYEASLHTAEQDSESKRVELSQMTAAVRSEFTRSQLEKSAAMKQVVSNFIQLQLEHSQRVTKVWQEVMESIQ